MSARIAASAAASLFLRRCRAAGLPIPAPEYRFAPPRRWRFDWSWPSSRVALEIEGGVWTRGRHTRGTGFLKDMEKYNEAGARGWIVLRCTPDGVLSSATLDYIKRALELDLEPHED